MNLPSLRPALVAGLLLAPLAPLAGAQDDPGLSEAMVERMDQLAFEHGTVDVDGGRATAVLPEGWSYLQQDDARFVVEDLWGNSPDESVVGLASPPGLDVEWAVVISFHELGHIDDSDAADMDPDELLEGMRADMESIGGRHNGWTVQPSYDASNHTLTWAQNLRFPGTEADTLNYDVRVLGRNGILSLNAVGGMGDLTAIRRGLPGLVGGVTFNEGHRYEDFDPSIDKVAAYGIGGLIAGKALLKTGLLAKLLKPLIVVGVALLAFGRRLLGRGGKAERRPVLAGPEGELAEPDDGFDDDERA